MNVAGHCVVVGVLLGLIGGTILGVNIRQAIAIRDAKTEQLETGQRQETPPISDTTDATVLPAEASAEHSASELPTAGPSPLASPGPSGTPVVVEQIPRVRVAAISMPLGIGFLIFVAGIISWLGRSVQAAQVGATLGGVAGVLMLILAVEHFGSLLDWAGDPLAPSAAALLAGGLICLSLPLHAWRSIATNSALSSSTP